MDMKRILQAVDGVTNKPVEGADSMAKFLRTVTEAEINQPAVTPVKIPPVPQLPAQDGDQGDGSRLTTNQDGTKTYAGAFGSFTYDAQGKAIKYAEPQFAGLGRSIDLATGQTTQNYNAGPMNTTQTTDAKGNVVSHNTEYDLGVGKMAMGRDAKGITSKAYTPADGEHSIASKDIYALGNKDKEATYNRAMAQVKSAPVQENIDKFLSIVRKNDVSILNEGKGPHKVTLPVQMAMQHYQTDQVVERKPRIIDKYFQEAEQAINQRKEDKRGLINQYAKVIAERVLMKENAVREHEAGFERVGMAGVGIQSAVAETPIDMSGDPNDPHIYGHEKANPMSLKGRIQQARNQLRELAELAESDELVVWERITRLSKGGMFMGLEQNLEQIRHGISELAAKRKRGGVASRGIDKNIGEDNDPCWDTHKMVGTKKKGRKTVPNCVPKE